MPYRVHAIQHAQGEDLGVIEKWCKEHKHSVSYTHIYQPSARLPQTDTFDWLVVLGGPMHVSHVEEYPWLEDEKEFIRDVIAQEKVVVGICLGAQMIVSAVGSKVFDCEKEIGWFPVSFTEEAQRIFPGIPPVCTSMLWHANEFELPPSALLLGSTAGCTHQGFILSDRVLGLQFHPEWEERHIATVLDSSAEDIEEGLYIQSVSTILASKKSYMKSAHDVLYCMLDVLSQVQPPQQNTLKINTSNANKFKEFSRIFAKYGILLDATTLDLKEVDGTPVEVIAHKATQVGDGVIVEDTSLDIEGAEVGINVKWILSNLTEYVGRKATWRVLLGLKQGESISIYEGVVNGVIVHPRGDNAFGFDPIFQVEGRDFTLGEMKPDNCNARSIAIENMCNGSLFCEHPPIYEWTGAWQNE